MKRKITTDIHSHFSADFSSDIKAEKLQRWSDWTASGPSEVGVTADV